MDSASCESIGWRAQREIGELLFLLWPVQICNCPEVQLCTVKPLRTHIHDTKGKVSEMKTVVGVLIKDGAVKAML
jgi:hypothetical protein